ncbi:MAG TPA: tetratricopeptide repeat protein, partial [Polyangia bacterium]
MRLLAALVLITSVGAGAAEPRFSPAGAEPYFAAGPAADAARALRLEEPAAAARGFSAYLKRHPHAADARQARFLQAYAQLKAGQFNDAARGFDALVKSYPLLVDYHRLWAARAHLQAGRAKEALARAKRIPSSSVLDGDARLVRAEAERALARPGEAAAEYQGYLEAYPSSWRASQTRLSLADALDAAGRHDEARAAYRRVYLEAPESWGKQAEAHLGKPLLPFSVDELMTRASALFDAMRNAESEAAWKTVLAAPGLPDPAACQARYHLAQSVFKERERWRSAPLFDAAAVACEKAHDEDLTTKSLYQGGRAWGQKGDKDPASTLKAAGLFERVWREHATHSYADDARLREAELYDELKNDAKATELLAGLPQAFPTGDQRGEAMWRLGFRAFRKGDLATAEHWLSSELAALPREDGWWEAGRTLYWLGRIAAQRGDQKTALDEYERAVVQYPLSFYALAALNRMREADPAREAALVERLSTDPGDPAGWRFPPRKLFGTPGFHRGVELARLGLGPEAKRELAAAGIVVPVKRDTVVTDPAQKELLWVAAVLYDRAGEYSISHFIPRWILTDYARAYPTGEARKKWLLSFPRAYADLIEKNTALTGQPAALELAVVREESAFDPLMESFANAIGLTQLTAPPAARFANGLPHDRAALHDPAINVAIGARELGQLWKAYAGNPALTIAGY